MKLTLSVVLGLAAVSLAQDADTPACPTVTKTVQERRCHKTCALTDCTFETTVLNPCGCPAALETATLIAPCDADCPYDGCDIDFRQYPLPCPLSTPPTTTSTSTSTTRRRPWPPTSPSPPPSSSTPTPTSTSWTGVVTSVVTLPPHTHTTTTKPPTTTPCPTITKTTSPADCPALRCPVPTCRVETDLVVPCGCTPNTLLYVQGCATDCPGGCLTRTRTVSETDC